MPGHYDKGLKTAVENNIPLIATSTDVSGRHLVKVGTQLSKMNNRLYRSTRNYDVQFQYTPLANEVDRVVLRFYTLPDTWFVRGAVRHAFQTYQTAMAEELAAGIKPGRWHDFQINEQDPDGAWDYLSGCLYDGNAWGGTSADELMPDATVTDSGGTSKGFHLFGTVTNSWNIFSEYAKKLAYRVPDDESVSSDQPYEGLLDLEDADVLAERGDRAPYDRDFSSFLHDGSDDQNILVQKDYLAVELDSSQGRMITRRFTAPLGIVLIEKWDGGSLTDFSSSWPELQMIASPGSYKGIKAPSLV